MAQIKKQDNLSKEKQLLEDQRKESENRARDARLEQHRRHLQEQVVIRQDYYSLTIFHKLIIVVMFVLLLSFVCFLLLSYFPPTKDTIFNLIHKIL